MAPIGTISLFVPIFLNAVYCSDVKTFQHEKPLCINGNSHPLQNTRLCDGANPGQCDPSKERLEVFLSSQWGTVCDDFWKDEYASVYDNEIVVCRMYGFADGRRDRQAFYGEGTGPIHLDNIKCSGTETSILHCPARPVGTHNCQHNEDVGVTCFN